MKKMTNKPVKQSKEKSVSKVAKSKMRLKKPIKAKKIAKSIHPKSTKKLVISKTKPKAKKIKVKPKSKTKIKQSKIMIKATIPKKILYTKQKLSVGPVDVKPYHIRAGEEYMNSAQIEHFRSILLRWKEQLLQEAETTKQDIQTTSANFPDPVDRASLEEEFNLELRARDRERKLIKKIEDTLQRITEDSYGYCDDCGAEIGIRRLEARPTATQCIECKTVSELKEKQVGEIGREEE